MQHYNQCLQVAKPTPYTHNRAAHYEMGLLAEERALFYLKMMGYKLLHHRYRSPYGEIDLIMQDEDTIVAIEVKYRKSIYDSHYAIQEKQQNRINNALMHYIGEMGQNNAFLRIDVVLLSASDEIIHYKNAW